MDIVGPFSRTERVNKYILVVVCDHFTCWMEAFPLLTLEASTIVWVRRMSLERARETTYRSSGSLKPC